MKEGGKLEGEGEGDGMMRYISYVTSEVGKKQAGWSWVGIISSAWKQFRLTLRKGLVPY